MVARRPRTTPPALGYPNRFARDYLAAYEHITGVISYPALIAIALPDVRLDRAALEAGIQSEDRAFPFTHIAALNAALDTHYKGRVGRGMALRIGQAWWNGMRGFGVLSGLEHPAFRALPQEQRCRVALQGLAALFSRSSDQQTTVDETARAYRITVDPCALAWGLRAERPLCQTMVGLLSACVTYASGGSRYAVRETQCRAVEGGACIFLVNKTPMIG